MRLKAARTPYFISEFQFTHPVRGATPQVSKSYIRLEVFQFTHPVRGATLYFLFFRPYMAGFNSRTPCGVRLECRTLLVNGVVVSIHAPRAGCDHILITSLFHDYCFNSRTPCGVRPSLLFEVLSTLELFQFTHPVRGATVLTTNSQQPLSVSIHAPRAGCDIID